MSPGLRLHRVGEADWESHRDLRLEMLQDSPVAYWTTFDEVVDRTEQEWREATRAAVVQVRDEGTPLGTATLITEGEHVPEGAGMVVAVYTVPRARGRGVGRMLMQALHDVAVGQGLTCLLLHVTSGNEPATALYRGLGYRFTGESFPHPARADLTELEMQLHLDHPASPDRLA